LSRSARRAREPGLRLRRSPGLAARPDRSGPSGYVTLFATCRSIGGLPILLLKDSGLRRTIPPYSRAAATAFHRLPVRGVSGGCGRRCWPPLAKLVMRVSSGSWLRCVAPMALEVSFLFFPSPYVLPGCERVIPRAKAHFGGGFFSHGIKRRATRTEVRGFHPQDRANFCRAYGAK
jgi:hypothetical protein